MMYVSVLYAIWLVLSSTYHCMIHYSLQTKANLKAHKLRAAVVNFDMYQNLHQQPDDRIPPIADHTV